MPSMMFWVLKRQCLFRYSDSLADLSVSYRSSSAEFRILKEWSEIEASCTTRFARYSSAYPIRLCFASSEIDSFSDWFGPWGSIEDKFS